MLPALGVDLILLTGSESTSWNTLVLILFVLSTVLRLTLYDHLLLRTTSQDPGAPSLLCVLLNHSLELIVRVCLNILLPCAIVVELASKLIPSLHSDKESFTGLLSWSFTLFARILILVSVGCTLMLIELSASKYPFRLFIDLTVL